MADINQYREIRRLRKEVKSLTKKLYVMIGVAVILMVCILVGAYQIHKMTDLVLSLQ